MLFTIDCAVALIARVTHHFAPPPPPPPHPPNHRDALPFAGKRHGRMDIELARFGPRRARPRAAQHEACSGRDEGGCARSALRHCRVP